MIDPPPYQTVTINVQLYMQSIIRSFVCSTKRPSVKQSVKQQVSSNFQIYPGKTDDRPPSQSLKWSQQLYIVYSFMCYPAFCVVIWS